MAAAFKLSFLLYLILTLCVCEYCTLSINLNDIVFIINSQRNPFHIKRSQIAVDSIIQQANNIEGDLEVELLHEKYSHDGAWTLFPIFKDFENDYQNKKWVFILDEITNVNLPFLVKELNKYDHNEELYLGHGLRDKTITIIHHFHQNLKFKFPDIYSGIAFTMPLIKRLSNDFKKTKTEFTIDMKHELAKFIYSSNDTTLTDVSFLCSKITGSDCATHYSNVIPKCGTAIGSNELFVAVKTCEAFHKDRIPIIQSLWTSGALHIEYYSETADPDIPTINLGIPNTERGHCGKLQAILERALTEDHIKHRQWLLIADDDTIISIPRLRKFLSCYDPSIPTAIGERYGYGANKGTGYDYITGGGGMVLSMSAVKRLVESGTAKCPTIESPDDMMLGIWLKRLKIPVTHSPLFHQARPEDYSVDYLSQQEPISFHKFWMVDPVTVWKEYLEEQEKHDEL